MEVKVKLTQSLLEEVKKDLSSKITGNHISHISLVNSCDILFQFSFYTKEKLFVSLNHHSPFISFAPKDFAISSTLNNLCENLRKIVKGTFINSVEILNDDRVLQFSLTKTNDFFEKEDLYLIFEFIPTKPNLIILDKNRKIIYAYRYFDLTHDRAILKGLDYPLLSRNGTYKKVDANYQEYQKEATSYLLFAVNKRKKEANKPLFDYLNSKRKSLVKKIEVLNKEKEEATEGLIYKEYGDMIYAYLYEEDALKEYVNDVLQDKYDINLSPTDNANRMYKIYKKNKRTIEYDDIEIAKAYKEKEEIEYILSIFEYLDDDEISELYNKYMAHHDKKKRKTKADPKLPFYVKYKNTVIGFGKNAEQNNYLTFKKANKNNTYLHVKDYHGAHVIIFNDNPANEELLVASEIVLILSNQVAGDIIYTKVSELKKGPELGQAIMNNYKLITLREIREETYKLLLEQKRFEK